MSIAKGHANDVVMVGPKTFPPVIGGIETHVYEISRRLVRKGFDVTVLVPRMMGMAPSGDYEGVHVVRVHCIRNRQLLKLSIVPSIARELKKNESALVHAHDATGGFAAALFSQRRRFVYTMHGLAFHVNDWPTPFRQGIRAMQASALRQARHVFCTDQLAAEHAKRFRNQVETLSNGVDVEAFEKGRLPRPKEFRDAFTLLFVGRMTSVKGVSVLLEAIGKIPEGKRKGMSFVFVGDGPLEAAVRSTSRDIQQILHLGRVDHSAIAPYFAYADAYLLPSLSEGVPISLLEAMAAGLPCIASDVGGIRPQTEDAKLMLLPPGNAQALSDAIIKLYEDRMLGRKLGDEARTYVARRFSWDSIVERIAQVYEEISGP